MNLNFQATTIEPYGAMIDLPTVTRHQRVTVQQVVTNFEGADPFAIDWRAELLIDDQPLARSCRGQFDGKKWNFVFTGMKIPAQRYGIRYVVRTGKNTWVPIRFKGA